MDYKIIKKIKLADDVFSFTFYAPKVAQASKPGQFLNVYIDDESRILPRPISICAADDTTVRIVFRTVGEGTAKLSELEEGDMVRLLGPLGNGYVLRAERAVLFGGGIGIPPMLELAKRLYESGVEVDVCLGYRDSRTFLSEEFKQYATVHIATDDGSTGFKGNVVELCRSLLSGHKLSDDGKIAFYACGPKPMLRGVVELATEKGFVCQVSLEERMACGIGACLACVCKSGDKDEHTNVNNKRVCKDGPVFYADEIEI